MILQLIRQMFAGGPYYVRLSKDTLFLRDVQAKKQVEIPAVAAVDVAGRIVSVCEVAPEPNVEMIRPLDHPRVVLNDFAGAEALVARAFADLVGRRHFMPAPVMVVHPVMELKGGITGIEMRALHEMAEGAGARKAFIHVGEHLTDEQVTVIASGG